MMRLPWMGGGRAADPLRLAPPDNSRYRYRDGSALATGPGYHPHTSTRFVHWDPDDRVAAERLPELYEGRDGCCGCTGCVAACPVGAIRMEPDEEGFDYPVVDAARCIGCRRCMDACAFALRRGARRQG